MVHIQNVSSAKRLHKKGLIKKKSFQQNVPIKNISVTKRVQEENLLSLEKV